MFTLSRILPFLFLFLIHLDLTSAALASYPGDPNVRICGDDKGKTPECTARISDEEVRDLRAIRMRLRLFIRDGLEFEDLDQYPSLLREGFDRENLEMEIREMNVRDRMDNENYQAERRGLEDGLKANTEAVEEIEHVVKMQRLLDAARDARGPRMGRRSRARRRMRTVGLEKDIQRFRTRMLE